MGTRHGDSKYAVAPSPLLLHVLALLLLAALANSKACKVDQCWRQFERSKNSEKVSQGPTATYCKVLKSLTECIRQTARSCRGDLQYHSTSSLVQQWYTDNNCSQLSMLPAYVPAPVTRPPPSGYRGGGGGGGGQSSSSGICVYNGRHEFAHCSLFGDPHLRTFTEEFQTCKILGAWPLVDNVYFAVQVTNEAVVPGASATATSKVTIIINGSPPCTSKKMYEAQVGSVPSAFVDGTTVNGHDRNVRIKEKDKNSHVEISIRHIGTTIVVRQVGGSLRIAIRMPSDLVDQESTPSGYGLYLCLRGCPASERIDYRQALANPEIWMNGGQFSGSSASSEFITSRALRDRAVAVCREYNVTDNFFDACVFDLMTTGNTSFGEAAVQALADLRQLNPGLLTGQPNRTWLLPPLDPVSSDSPGVGEPNSSSALVRTDGVLIFASFFFAILVSLINSNLINRSTVVR